MRVDLNVPTTADLASSSTSASRRSSNRSHEAETSSPQDTASLSTGSGHVQALAARLRDVPDVRQQRVEALRDLVSSGKYQMSPQRTAEAMLSDFDIFG
jgi:negative regulator of flagellin synthesis FlgM